VSAATPSRGTGATGRAVELRLAFDRGFAQPVERDAAANTDLLAIRVGAETCAVRLREIAGLFVDKKITPIPGSAPALLGVAGFRGAIMPVFNLQSLLARSSAATPRWLVIAASTPVALAFDAFEGQMRLSPDAILPRPPGAPVQSYAREFVRMPAQLCPVIDLPLILDAIKAQKSPQQSNAKPDLRPDVRSDLAPREER
jgi:purine-binding chemotaxis protein CheW